jgi:predicted DNA-binding transcriptional regulator YafY
MRRAERLLQLIQVLRQHRRSVTGEAIAAELEVSVRSVYRDIAALQAQMCAVRYRCDAGIGRMLSRRRTALLKQWQDEIRCGIAAPDLDLLT